MSEKVEFILTVNDQGSKALRRANGYLDDMKKKSKKVDKEVKSLNKMISDSTLKFGAFSAAMSLVGASMTNATAEFDQLRLAYDRTTQKFNINGNQLITEMENVSKGAISQKDLILAANRAMALGVGKSQEQIVELLEISRVKAQTMGISMNQAFNDIVTGLGRASPLILDNLGITIKLGSANEQYAKQLGKTVNQLTDNERKQALLNAVLSEGRRELEETGEVNITAAEKIQRMKARTENLRIELGRALLPTMNKVVDIVEKMTKYIANLTDELKEWIAKIGVAATAAAALLAVIGSLIKAFAALKAIMIASIAASKAFAAGAAAIGVSVGALIPILGAATVGVYALVTAYNELNAVNKQLDAGVERNVEGINRIEKRNESLLKSENEKVREFAQLRQKQLFFEKQFQFAVRSGNESNEKHAREKADAIKVQLQQLSKETEVQSALQANSAENLANRIKESSKNITSDLDSVGGGFDDLSTSSGGAASEVEENTKSIEEKIEELKNAQDEAMGEIQSIQSDYTESVRESKNEVARLTEEFEKNIQTIRDNIGAVQSEIDALEGKRQKVQQDRNKDVVNEIIDQKKLIDTLKEKIDLKKQELQKEPDQKKRTEDKQEISGLEEQLAKEQEAFKSFADIQKELENEIAEQEKFNALTGFEQKMQLIEQERQRRQDQINEEKKELEEKLNNLKNELQEREKEHQAHLDRLEVKRQDDLKRFQSYLALRKAAWDRHISSMAVQSFGGDAGQIVQPVSGNTSNNNFTNNITNNISGNVREEADINRVAESVSQKLANNLFNANQGLATR